MIVLICLLTLVLATALNETHENTTHASSIVSVNEAHNGSLSGTFADWWKMLLSAAALVLSVVNGLMLLWGYLRDRPILDVSIVEPDTQWFFAFPEGTYQGHPTRKHGFLTYIKVVNRGRRDVSLDSWYLYIKSVGGKQIELKPLSIPQPQIKLGDSENFKLFPVLGQPMVTGHGGDTMTKSGDFVTGFAYYVIEFYGSNNHNIVIKDKITEGKIMVKSAFGNKCSTKIRFNQISLEKAKDFVKGIDKIDVHADSSNEGSRNT